MSHLLWGGDLASPEAVPARAADFPQPQPVLAADDTTAHCDIAIVGGGVAGLHTALRLAARHGPRICLFEQDERLGGRVLDVPASREHSDGPFIQLGARRIMEGQSVLVELAAELGIALQKPEMLEELGFTRGMYATCNDDFIRVFPGLDVDRRRGGYEVQLYDRLLNGPERAHVDRYPNLRAYAEKVIGSEGCAFLHDTYRFRADHEYDLNAKAYLDYLDEENDAGAICPSGHCQSLYPVGGMSAYTRGMERRARELGVQIHLGEAVLCMEKSPGGYLLKTARRALTARTLVLALPPVALQQVRGELVQSICAQPEFQALIGVRVTTITQWYAEPWWRGIVTPGGRHVWRAWTTGHCINSVEIPLEAYAAPQNAIRVVYNDRSDCADFWARLAQGPLEALEKEVAVGLNHLFANNGVTRPVTIGPPSKTVFREWPDAWYYLRAGNAFTNRDIYRWAVQPLPGEDVALVSDGYNPQRSGWADAAYKSSLHYLNQRFGMGLPGLERIARRH